VIVTPIGFTMLLPARLPSDDSQIIEMRPPSRSAVACGVVR
jgi:hypothetical protein